MIMDLKVDCIIKVYHSILNMLVSFIRRQANVTHSLARATLFMANPQPFYHPPHYIFDIYYE